MSLIRCSRILLCGLAHMLPPTCGYRMEALLYRFAGFDVAPTARIVSGARFGGYMPVHKRNDTFIGLGASFFGGTVVPIFIGDCVDIVPKVLVVTGSHQIDNVAGRGYSRPVRIEDGYQARMLRLWVIENLSWHTQCQKMLDFIEQL